MTANSLELLTRADALLLRATTLPVVLETLTMADQARHLAQALDLGASAMNHCTAIKVKCERRLADLVDTGQASGDIATPGMNQHSRGGPKSGLPPVTLAEVGIDKRRLAEARATKGVTVSVKDMLHWASQLPFTFDPSELRLPVVAEAS